MKKLFKVLKSYNLSDNIDKQLLINWGVGKENRGNVPLPPDRTQKICKKWRTAHASLQIEKIESRINFKFSLIIFKVFKIYSN